MEGTSKRTRSKRVMVFELYLNRFMVFTIDNRLASCVRSGSFFGRDLNFTYCKSDELELDSSNGDLPSLCDEEESS